METHAIKLLVHSFMSFMLMLMLEGVKNSAEHWRLSRVSTMYFNSETLQLYVVCHFATLICFSCMHISEHQSIKPMLYFTVTYTVT